MTEKSAIDLTNLLPVRNILLVIGGPTASGKTALSISLAKHFNTVVLSADSRQFYHELYVGTARPGRDEMQEVQHFFSGDRSIHQALSAGGFGLQARACIEELFKSYPILIACGGSGLYIDALMGRLHPVTQIDPACREKLNSELASNGLDFLVGQLLKADPETAGIIDLRNPRRVIRALELAMYGSVKKSELMKKVRAGNNFTCLTYFLDPPRELLYQKIHERVDEMIKKGLEQEVRNLESFRHLQALQTVGYREWWDYFDGKSSLEETIENIRTNTRRYAKRQLTWFRNSPGFVALNEHAFDRIVQDCDRFLLK